MGHLIDHYLTIREPAVGEFKDKGSKFLAYAFPFEHENQLNAYISQLRSEHIKAHHFCFAYKIGLDPNRFRANDDGEPSGSAGKPILGQINSHGLTSVLVVVVRYFGGTKLGVPGLIAAYKGATSEVLAMAPTITKVLSNTYIARFDYEQMGHVMNAFKACNIELLSKVFNEDCAVTFDVRLSDEVETLHRLRAKILNKSLEEVHWETEIDFCKIEISTVPFL
jgi:uncharacterized YigZ family protein